MRLTLEIQLYPIVPYRNEAHWEIPNPYHTFGGFSASGVAANP